MKVRIASPGTVHMRPHLLLKLGFPGGSGVKNPSAGAGDAGLIPGLGRSSGGGNGNPLQSSCLVNPMDRGAWGSTVHGIAKELDITYQLKSNFLSHCLPKLQWGFFKEEDLDSTPILFYLKNDLYRSILCTGSIMFLPHICRTLYTLQTTLTSIISFNLTKLCVI